MLAGDEMRLTIVYDNTVYRDTRGLKPDWGFACVLETSQKTVLFDTGTRGTILLHNMTMLSLNPEAVDIVVISHEHADHKGGLEAMARHVHKADLFELTTECPYPKFHLHSSEKPVPITKDIWTTGRLTGVMDEQSLVVRGKKGWWVVVGCSHPGVQKILHAAGQWGDMSGLVGGFHGFDIFQLLEPLTYICPCHCTQYIGKIKKFYPQKYIPGGVGQFIDL